jgi:hypothetical protein
MANNELSVYEKVEKVLFKSRDEVSTVLTPTQIEVKERLMACVSTLMANPTTPDNDLVTFLMNGCGGTCIKVSQSQAYNDVAAIKKMVGNFPLASKTWYRFMIIEGAKEGFEIAKAAKDAKGMAACLDKIGKYTRCDKEDEDFDWTQMIPPSFEPSDDITLLENMEPIENLEEERKAFRALFKRDMNKKATEAIITE